MNKDKKAFTLIELIITIIILAILGTIAVISLQGYSESARDSTRISDLSVMKTSLELFHLNAGKYPETTDSISITYSGTEVWTQGIFGETTKNNVEKLDKVPKDPITEKEYTYSLTKTKQEYQLAGLIEGDEIVLNNNILFNQTNAGEKIGKAIVTGNYNGQTLKAGTGIVCEILSIPSIISSETETIDLKIILDNKNLVYNGFNNLPSNYKKTKYKTNNGFNFSTEKLIVYSDNQECKPLYDPENPSARINLVKNLQTAYSGTLIENSANIRGLVTLDTSNMDAVNTLSATIINNNLGGKLSSKRSDKLVCEDGKHTEDGINCISDISTCSIENGTGTNTRNGTNWDCSINTCNTDYYDNGDGTCNPVGIGYYSNGTGITRIICTNKPTNSTYTSDGNGTNNCAFSCNSGYSRNGTSCYIPYLANNSHTEAQCTSAGGSIYSNFCKFTRSSCPSGWNQYLNWATTATTSCGYGTNCSKCTVTGLSWRNSIVKCQYCMTGANWATVRVNCYATLTQVGCY